MTESSNFREINDIESKIISKSLFNISPNILEFLKRSEKKLYISLRKSDLKTNYPFLYLISNTFQEDINLIENKSNIYSAGLYFGFIKKGDFYLSLEGAEFLYRQHPLISKKGIFC
jgi:ribosome biogenesis protein Nip4